MERPLGARMAASFNGASISFVGLVAVGALLPSPFKEGIIFTAFPGAIVGGWRGQRVSLVVDERTIVVKNYFRTHVLEWADVLEVGLGTHYVGVPQPAISFWLRTGSAITSQATTKRAVRTRVLTELRAMDSARHVRFLP